MVDGVAHLPQVVAQFAFLLTLHLEPRNRHRRARQDGENRHRDDQLHERKARFASCTRRSQIPPHTHPSTTAGQGVICMIARDPVAGSGCCVLFRTTGRVITTAASPAAFAWKVITHTAPVPVTPCVPGGRDAEMATLPLPSSRCTSATACPSCPRKFTPLPGESPRSTLIRLSFVSSYCTCIGTEKTSVPPERFTATWNVDPTFCWLISGVSCSFTGPAFASCCMLVTAVVAAAVALAGAGAPAGGATVKTPGFWPV